MRYLNAGFASALLLVSPMSPIWLPGEVVQAQTAQDRKAEAPVLAQAVDQRKVEADRLFQQGIQQFQTSQFEAALRLWQQALKLYQETDNRKGEGNALVNLGIAYQKLGNYGKAIEYQEQASAIFRATNDHLGEGIALSFLGLAYFELHSYRKAIDYSEQALVVLQQSKDQWRKGTPLGILGSAYFELGDYRKAIDYSEQALPIFQAIKTRQDEGNALFNLGRASQKLNIYRKAIEYYEQYLAITREIKNRQREATVLNGLGIAHHLLGNNAKAIEYHQQALVILQETNNRQDEGAVLNNLGVVYTSLSNYGKAIEYLEQALAIGRETKDGEGEGSALGSLGSVYFALGNPNKAINYHKQALAIFRKINNRREEGASLGNLGADYDMLGNYAKAIEYQEQWLAISRTIKDRLGKIASLSSLGLAHLSLGNYAKAIEYTQQSLAIAREIKNRDAEGASLGNLGLAYLNLGNYTQAIEYEQQLLAIAREIGDRAREGIALSNIGITLEKQKQPELAIVFYKQSVNVRESIRENIRKLPRESQEAYAQSVAGTYRSLADLLIQQGRLPEAQAVLELLKLRELKDFTRDAGIDSPGISLARVEDAALKQILQRYTTIGAFSQKIDACEQTHCPELKQLQDQRDQLNQAVTTELTQQRAILTKYFSTESATLTPDKLTPEARDIVNAQPGTILIYPLILKSKIQFLIALKAGDGAVILRPVETPNVSADTLFKTIQTFREQLQAPTNLAALKATSQQLYTWLIKPLEPELNNPAIKHLVFAPDSTTRYIPLAALFDGKRYLIERFSISTITAASETDTSETFTQLQVNDQFLLATGASTFANANPLENVPAELNAIVKPPNSRDQQGIYPGAELLNTQFDFEALKANLKGHRVLHIATHGSFQPGRVEDSYLLSGRSEKLTTTLINQLGQYGLKGIHLVVLSACETAVGDRASDGIEIPGISYFFLKNKVKAVMASLWSVNDASTSLMMQQFYKQLATGKMTKAEALQLVQQQFITGKLTAKDAPSRSPTLVPKGNAQTRQSANGDFSHPFYWAPFILIGNSL